MITDRYRWETSARWYEVHVGRDLFGDLVLIRRWGAKPDALGGQLIELLVDEAMVQKRLDTIDAERGRRKPPYRRIIF